MVSPIFLHLERSVPHARRRSHCSQSCGQDAYDYLDNRLPRLLLHTPLISFTWFVTIVGGRLA